MASKQRIAKRPKPKTVLRLPDLDQSKNAVVNSLGATTSKGILDTLSMSSSEARSLWNVQLHEQVYGKAVATTKSSVCKHAEYSGKFLTVMGLSSPMRPC
jgi:hypothetical protein